MFEALEQKRVQIDLPTQLRELREHGLTSIRFHDVIIDLLRPMLPVHTQTLDRSIRAQVLGQETGISSAETLIVMKLMAMRPQDEADIQDLIATYGASLDLDFIRREFETFADPSDPRRGKFESWVAPSSSAG